MGLHMEAAIWREVFNFVPFVVAGAAIVAAVIVSKGYAINRWRKKK